MQAVDRRGGSSADNSAGEQPSFAEHSIEELVTTPTDFGDKLVEVSGVLDHMCRNSGDKLRIKDESGLSLQVMLGDKSDRFSVEMEGTLLKVRGQFKFEVTNLEEGGIERHHHAEDEEHECESEVAAIEALKERGIDPAIRTFIMLSDFQVL